LHEIILETIKNRFN